MTNAGGTILVVDDEIGIRRILRVCLTSAGFVVHESASGREALRSVSEIQPDLILLDLRLPDMDGSKVVTRVRESNQCPILILSIRDQESDKVTALDAGADDYLTKPFGNRELLARIRALLRRRRGEALAAGLKCGPFTIDAAHHAAQVAGNPFASPAPNTHCSNRSCSARAMLPHIVNSYVRCGTGCTTNMLYTCST